MAETQSPTPPFDAYHELLGIAPEEQPPTFYRLLGLTLFEANPNVIERAADRQMVHLRGFQTGPHAEASQRLLNEVAKARRVLLHEEQKATYDKTLRQKTESAAKRLAVATPISDSQTPDATQAPHVVPEFTVSAKPQLRRSKSVTIPLVLGIGVAAATLMAVVAVFMQESNGPPVATLPPAADPPAANRHIPPSVVPPPVVPPPVVPPAATSPDTPGETALPAVPVDPMQTTDEPSAEASDVVAAPPADPPKIEPATAAPGEAPMPPAATNDAEKFKAEVEEARRTLKGHPKFKKYYDFLQAHPESISANGPKLAALLWDEVQQNKVIADHLPSLAAALQEVERLALAGEDFTLALDALDARQTNSKLGLSDEQALTSRCRIITAAVELATSAKGSAQQRTEVKGWAQAALESALAAGEYRAVAILLQAETELMRSSIERVDAVGRWQPLARKALSVERLELATAIVDQVDVLLKNTTPGKQRKEAADHNQRLREQITTAVAAADAKKTLESRPDDPAANQALALHLLTNRGEWKESLAHFAKGTDSKWKQLADETLRAKDGKSKAALAERWSTLVDDPSSPGKELARRLYQEALADPGLVGLARSAAQEKARVLGLMEPVSPAPPESPAATAGQAETARQPEKPLPLNKWIELLPLIDFNEDVVRGYWYPQGNRLICESVFESRLRVPVELANVDYDLQIDFDLGKDADDVVVILPVGDRNVMAVIDGFENREFSFFNKIQGKEAHQHPRAVRANLLVADKPHRFDISVRLSGDKAHTTFAINGAPAFEYDGPLTDYSSPWTVGGMSWLGLSTSETEIAYRGCRVRVTKGEARLVRSAPPPDPWPAKLKALKPMPLTGMKPLSAMAHLNQLGVSQGTRHPLIHGKECRDYLFAHATSSLTYSVPPNASYFTAYAYTARSPSVRFTVKVDGNVLFECQDRAITPVIVELPADAKEIQLECDGLGDVARDHSCWCYPAFR